MSEENSTAATGESDNLVPVADGAVAPQDVSLPTQSPIKHTARVHVFTRYFGNGRVIRFQIR